MRRPPLLAAMALASTWALAARPLGAEPAPADSEPLAMSADRLELDLEAKTATLTGHVKLARGPLILRCPRVDVRYDDVPHVTWARGSGGVVVEIKGVRAEAPDVEVDLGARVLSLRGGVHIARGDGWLTAERARIDMGSGKVSMDDVKGSLPLPKPSP